jgi:hypothetical protein
MKAKPDDGLGGLRERYPGWSIEARWVARANAGDYRKLRAERDDVAVEASDADTLARRIREAEALA